MPTPNPTAIRARVDAFVAELSTSIRQAALQAVEEALGGSLTRKAPSANSSATKATPAPRRKKARRKRSGGAKRVTPATALAALKAAGGPVLAERLAASLGTDSATLRPVLEGLMASGQVKRAGKKRGTTYEAKAGGGAGGSAAKKQGAKKVAKKAGKKVAKKKSATGRATATSKGDAAAPK